MSSPAAVVMPLRDRIVALAGGLIAGLGFLAVYFLAVRNR
jgi:hypothetical protein